jgi:hypothetical protein
LNCLIFFWKNGVLKVLKSLKNRESFPMLKLAQFKLSMFA